MFLSNIVVIVGEQVHKLKPHGYCFISYRNYSLYITFLVLFPSFLFILQSLMEVKESDFKKLGITNTNDRSVLMSSLAKFRAVTQRSQIPAAGQAGQWSRITLFEFKTMFLCT